MKREKGLQCSKNFVFDKEITSIEEFEKITLTSISLFYIHRVYPTAFVGHQSYTILKNQIRRGNIWTIKKIKL